MITACVPVLRAIARRWRLAAAFSAFFR